MGIFLCNFEDLGLAKYMHYSVRDNGTVIKKAAYVIIGKDLEGQKDVLGIWLGANESSK